MASLSHIVEQQLQASREQAEYRAERNLNRALEDGSFRQAYRELKELEVRLAVGGIDAKETPPLQKRKIQLKGILAERLKKLGMNEQDLVPQYACKKCGDTGISGTHFCTCYREKLAALSASPIGIPIGLCPTFRDDTAAKPQALETLYRKMREFCDKFPSTAIRNLLFTGSTGGGKTFLASIVAREISEKKYSSVVVTAFALNRLFVRYHTEPGEKPDLSPLTDCDLLVIDDLGTEQIYKNVTLEYLLSTISERILAQKHTIITTNLTPEELLDRYGDRLYSRLMDKRIGRAIKFPDTDFRLIKE
ncbi:MAG: ATP-binding protein [Firmicutes bacterium]|nr:ATP-binding protein [Bacillota bacterium]